MQFVTIKLQDRNTDVLDVKLLCALIQLNRYFVSFGSACSSSD